MPCHVADDDYDVATRVIERSIGSFMTSLLGFGYCTAVVQRKGAMVTAFARWVGQHRLDATKIDEATVGTFLAHLRRRRIPISKWRCTLTSFLEHLHASGFTAGPKQRRDDDASAAPILKRYETYLLNQRGLTKKTVCNYLRFVSPFARKHFSATGSSATTLGFQEVRDYILSGIRTFKPTTAQPLATALRSFLRFLFFRGETVVDLALAVPRARRWRKATVHSYLRPEDVERLLAVCDKTTASGRRDHAILLLLARLGIRACEVAAIEIRDLRWRTGEIVLRGKGRVRQHVPMLPDVGAAVALYLRDGRPKSPCRNVFLRNDAPRIGLSADAVGFIVRRALVRAGLKPPHRGSHLLRFSLATNMIHRGATMAEIGQVLRHRSPETTEIYAKVDFAGLRTVALPWVGQGGVL